MQKCHGPEDSANPDYPCPAFPRTTLHTAQGQYPTAHHHSQQPLGSAPKQCFLIPHELKTSSVWCPHHQSLLQLGFCMPGAVHSMMQTTICGGSLMTNVSIASCLRLNLYFPIERLWIKSRGCFVSPFPTASCWYARKSICKMSCRVLCFGKWNRPGPFFYFWLWKQVLH